MTSILGEEEIFGKLERLFCLDTLLVENFDEIPLSHTVKEIQAVFVFYSLRKFLPEERSV